MLSKPSRGILPNKSHPLVKNMTLCMLNNEGTGEQCMNLLDISTPGQCSYVTWRPGGIGFLTNASCVKFQDPGHYINQNEGTLHYTIRKEAGLTWSQYGSIFNIENESNTSPHEMINMLNSALYFYPNYDQNSDIFWYFSSDLFSSMITTEFNSITYTWKNGKSLCGFYNGIITGTLSGSPSWNSSEWINDEILWIGKSGGVPYSCKSRLGLLYLWNVALPNDQVFRLALNPYQIFQ